MDALTMPWSVGIRFSHAALQVLAEDAGVDLLHIKGPAVDDSLGGATRRSIDADVLVRPAHVDRLLEAMHRHGWTTQYRFEDGSAFEHASTLVHPFLAPVDVHRRFPGIDGEPSVAFARLWADRGSTDLAGMPCAVPSVAAQRLILIVHAARGGRLTHPDIERSWTEASADERTELIGLADELGAGVALAAGTGRLNEFAAQPGYALWTVLSTGERSRAKIWAARVQAAPTRRAALRVAVRLVVPNRHRMAISMGRPPTSREVAAAYVVSARGTTYELIKAVRSWGLARRSP